MIMKTAILKKCFLAVALLVAVSANGYAQWDASKAHLTVDWQMHAPLSTGFADKISGWGMNFEGTYDITRHWALGAFINFHTNHNYIPRQTLPISSGASLTTDQLRSAFQLPFGLTAAYSLSASGSIRPYLGAKAGAVMTRYSTYYGTGGVYDKPWGFYVSPEIGVKVYPWKGHRIGLHLAGYYSYLTNQISTLTMNVDGQSGAGFRVGVIF